MRVLIVGDVHGQHDRLAVLARGRRGLNIDAAIQVGDYGFDEGAMTSRHAPYPVPVHVIDGNHEDHGWLQRALEAGADARWRTDLDLFYQPRPSVTRIGTTTVGFIGGALHVDRPQRHNRVAGLPNYILRRQADEASALFNRDAARADRVPLVPVEDRYRRGGAGELSGRRHRPHHLGRLRPRSERGLRRGGTQPDLAGARVPAARLGVRTPSPPARDRRSTTRTSCAWATSTHRRPRASSGTPSDGLTAVPRDH